MSMILKKFNFIIIGLMKFGIIMLYEDLDCYLDIFMVSWKELGYFVGFDFGGLIYLFLFVVKLVEYDQIFVGVKFGQIFGESLIYYIKLFKL